MSTYKLIQNIEAEDHVLGPLTIRQFIFALIAALCFYLSFFVYSKHVPFLMILFLPPGIFFGFFAIPFGRDQPTEIWALAKIRFLLKPKKRLWDQSGVKELVTVTAPKKIILDYTNNLSPHEVKSRLQTLANTLDSRGWAIKNADAPYMTPSYINQTTPADSDRLVSINYLPQPVSELSNSQVDDVLDDDTSQLAQQFQQMIDISNTTHKQQIMDNLNSNAPAPIQTQTDNQWFMPKIDNTQMPVSATDVPAGDESPEDKELSERIKNTREKEQDLYKTSMRTLTPLSEQQKQKSSDGSGLTERVNPDILKWVRDDVTIATIGKETKQPKGGENKDDEVVVSLR